ncbi:restriction endonuclease [Microbispora sp. H10836]|uniref:restriction endonuclease n=1 Tax=Microbispora sp. H10836 TaxID=2729106 RepID=UPI0014737FD7|nr:restriction endonuclease [Microbispora sp. H10836]
MGFDTYLKIDGRIILMWRKYAGNIPRLLFRHDQLRIGRREGADETVISVTYQARVEEILENLADIGLGWHATLSAYSDIRMARGVSTGMLAGALFSGEVPEAEFESKFEEFLILSPEVDLNALGELMAYQWNDGDADDVPLIKDITYDGDIPNPGHVCDEVLRAAMQAGIPNTFAAVRAAESLAYLYRDAPVLAWPIIICIFLQHLRAESVVTLDLTEDAEATAGVTTEEEAQAYAAEYWTQAAEGLTKWAHTMGHLFGVLASFDSKLSRHFWFARAADLHGRLLAASSLSETTMRERGNLLEDLIVAILKTEAPELQVIEKNFRTREEEIDVVVANGLTNPFWVAQGSPLIMIECKNWRDRPGVQELRVLESKIQDRNAICKIGIFVSMSGFSRTFLDRLKIFQAGGGMIFAVSGDDLANIITSKIRLTDWLRSEGMLRALGK